MFTVILSLCFCYKISMYVVFNLLHRLKVMGGLLYPTRQNVISSRNFFSVHIVPNNPDKIVGRASRRGRLADAWPASRTRPVASRRESETQSGNWRSSQGIRGSGACIPSVVHLKLVHDKIDATFYTISVCIACRTGCDARRPDAPWTAAQPSTLNGYTRFFFKVHILIYNYI